MESSTTPNYGEKRIQRNTRIKSAIHDVYFFGHSEAIKKTPYKVKTRFLRDEGEISPCSVCGRAARAARPTTHRRSAEPRARRDVGEMRCRRDGSETEASWRRAGGETQTEASWRRDADGGGGEMADAGERRGRDGGEMEARRGRDGGGDATRVAATCGRASHRASVTYGRNLLIHRTVQTPSWMLARYSLDCGQ